LRIATLFLRDAMGSAYQKRYITRLLLQRLHPSGKGSRIHHFPALVAKDARRLTCGN
jgi:hypothetical protein